MSDNVFIHFLYEIPYLPLTAIFKYEPPRGKINNVVSEQVQHKLGCTSTEDV